MTDDEIIEAAAIEVMEAEKVHMRSKPIAYDAVQKRWKIVEIFDDGVVLLDWNPVVDMNHTFMVLKKMKEKCHQVEVYANEMSDQWFAMFDSSIASDDQPRRAICLAAIRKMRRRQQ